MGHLIETVHGLQKIEKDKGTLNWVYFVIGAVIALLIVIAGFIYYKKGNYLKQLCSAKRQGKFLMPTVPLVYHAVPVKSGDGIHNPKRYFLSTTKSKPAAGRPSVQTTDISSF